MNKEHSEFPNKLTTQFIHLSESSYTNSFFSLLLNEIYIRKKVTTKRKLINNYMQVNNNNSVIKKKTIIL